MSAKKLFVVAGEASGDLHGARLIEALRAKNRSLEIHGTGGKRMELLGLPDFQDLARFHVTGLVEAIKKLPEYRRAEKILVEALRRAKPDAVVFIDNPGFNLHISKTVRAMGIPVVYYIAPQIWAWAPQRIKIIEKNVSKVLVVFDFEEKLYSEHAVPVSFVGHPLKDFMPAAVRRDMRTLSPLVALLPGSRLHEVKMLLPILLQAAERIQSHLPGARFSLIRSSAIPLAVYHARLGASKAPVDLVPDEDYSVRGHADLAIACSGTATLECALLETPVVITNKAPYLTYLLAKKLIKVPYLGLPNLILNERKFPEFLQKDATGRKLGDAAVDILTSRDRHHAMVESCREVSRRLGGAGATARAADEILNFLK